MLQWGVQAWGQPEPLAQALEFFFQLARYRHLWTSGPQVQPIQARQTNQPLQTTASLDTPSQTPRIHRGQASFLGDHEPRPYRTVATSQLASAVQAHAAQAQAHRH